MCHTWHVRHVWHAYAVIAVDGLINRTKRNEPSFYETRKVKHLSPLSARRGLPLCVCLCVEVCVFVPMTGHCLGQLFPCLPVLLSLSCALCDLCGMKRNSFQVGHKFLSAVFLCHRFASSMCEQSYQDSLPDVLS